MDGTSGPPTAKRLVQFLQRERDLTMHVEVMDRLHADRRNLYFALGRKRPDDIVDRVQEFTKNVFKKLRIRVRAVDIQELKLARERVLASNNDGIYRSEQVLQNWEAQHVDQTDPRAAPLRVRDELKFLTPGRASA